MNTQQLVNTLMILVMLFLSSASLESKAVRHLRRTALRLVI
jgi:hypothetical protein